MSAGATIAWRPARARVAIRAAGWRLEFVALAAIWGSSFLMIKVLGQHWAPLDVALGRVALGALTLVAVLAVRGERPPRGRDVWSREAMVGQLACAAAALCYGLGITFTRRALGGRAESGLALACAQLLCATATL